MTPVPAAGPLSRVLVADDTTVKGSAGYQLGPGANPLVVLRRTAFLDSEGGRAEKAVKGLLRWAARPRSGRTG